MAETAIPHFHNDIGVSTIHVGTKEFMCMGAEPPFDHPHIFLDMGDEAEVVCPYCSTLYKYRPELGPRGAEPETCVYSDVMD